MPKLLPLFLAMVSVVMFRPVHTWFEQLLRGRNRVAAVITTALVLDYPNVAELRFAERSFVGVRSEC